jgi:hypothetical protein
VKFREYLPLALAVLALLVALAQAVHPFGFRVHPLLLVIVAALLLLRHLMRHQRQNRQELLRSVPRQPLGLEEHDHRTSE